MRVLFTTLSALALFFAASVEACANYEDCKCHVPGTDLQNNEATQKACDQYARDHNAQAKFSADPHHQVCHIRATTSSKLMTYSVPRVDLAME